MIKHECVSYVDKYGNLVPRNISCMVNVAVGKKDGHKLQPLFLEKRRNDLVRSHAGIDEAGLLRGIIDDDVAVRLKRSRRKT